MRIINSVILICVQFVAEGGSERKCMNVECGVSVQITVYFVA